MSLPLKLILIGLILLSSPLQADKGRTVTITTLEFPPYVSAEIPGYGWAWQVAKQALEHQGYQAELQIYPWARAVKMVERGEIDALYIANKTTEREHWARFSEQVGEESSVLWKKQKSQIRFDDLEELKQFRIAGLRASSQLKFLVERGIDVQPVNNFQQGLKMLNGDRVDLLVADKMATAHMLNQMPEKVRNQLSYLSPPLHEVGFYLAVSRKVVDNAAITEAFNSGLKHLRESGRYQAILAEYNMIVPSQD